MWKCRSLQFRLNALFALVLVLGLPINVDRQLLEAGPRVHTEVRLAREFEETLIGDLKDSPDPDSKLSDIVDSLSRLRHVSTTHRNDAVATSIAPIRAIDAEGSEDAPPEWFVALLRAEQTNVSVPIAIDGKSLGSLVIASHPTDEIAEISGLTAYAGYSEANRAPTPLELGCADPAHPCIIAAFLVSDPPLKQVVSRTSRQACATSKNSALASLDESSAPFARRIQTTSSPFPVRSCRGSAIF